MSGLLAPPAFRAALLSVARSERDAWLDGVLGIDALPDDGPDLPRGCVPYYPCSVDALLRMSDEARVTDADVFVDVGAGLGRAALFVRLLTGATVLGLEVQPGLVRAAREIASRLGLAHVSFIEGDASTEIGLVAGGSVFFLYCPFSGERLATVMRALSRIARERTIRVGCVDLPLPPCPWLTRVSGSDGDLVVYQSNLMVGSEPT